MATFPRLPVQQVLGDLARQDLLGAVEELTDSGRYVAVERAADDPDLVDTEAAIALLAASGLASVAEVILPASLPLTDATAFDGLCAQARDQGVPLTVTAIDAVDACLSAVAGQRAMGRDVGVALAAALRRTEADCREAGGRIRIMKGTASGPDAFGHAIEVDKSYVRCAKALLRRGADVTPSFATHDGRLIEIIESLAVRFEREHGPTDLEFVMPLGRGATMQQRLIDSGARVRVVIPFGPGWVGRFVSALPDRPVSFLRSLIPGA